VEGWQQLHGRLVRLHPRRRFNEALQRLDDLQAGLLRGTRQGTKDRRLAWQNLAGRLRRVRPAQGLQQRRETLATNRHRLHELTQAQLRNWKNRFTAIESRLRLLGPEQVLARGYSITLDAAAGTVIRRARDVKSGQQLRTRVQEGEISSRAEK